jgi:hypothetical protein
MNKTSFELITEDDKTDVDQEEAFYYHTINAFAALIVLYGYDKVIKDLKLKMKERPR